MTAIQITGALTMLSTNGDGPQLLTEAAEFLNALAQMGVQMAVEINLRPVTHEATIRENPIVAPTPMGAIAPTLAPILAPAQTITHPISTEPPPPTTLSVGSFTPAPVDFTTAAPAQPDAPRRNALTAWRELTREQRTALLNMEGCELAKQLGHAPTMVEWDARRPSEYPSASGVSKYLNIGWTYLAASWSQS